MRGQYKTACKCSTTHLFQAADRQTDSHFTRKRSKKGLYMFVPVLLYWCTGKPKVVVFHYVPIQSSSNLVWLLFARVRSYTECISWVWLVQKGNNWIISGLQLNVSRTLRLDPPLPLPLPTSSCAIETNIAQKPSLNIVCSLVWVMVTVFKDIGEFEILI